MRKWCLIILAVLLLAGCGVETQDEERLQDLDFTVMDLEKVPEELLHKQISDELFERDYTTIQQQIDEFKKR